MSSPSPYLKKEIIRAGAGAGKTTRLTTNIYNFIKSYKQEMGRMPKITATTFTIKATQELKERLLVLCLNENDFETINYINNSGNIQISTIHGVLYNFLQHYGHIVGVDSGFELLDSSKVLMVEKKILLEMMEEKKHQILFDNYSFYQIQDMLSDFKQNLYIVTQPEALAESGHLLDLIKGKYLQFQEQLDVITNEHLDNLDNERWVGYLVSFKKLLSQEYDFNRDLIAEIKALGNKPNKKGVSEILNQQLEYLLKEFKAYFSQYGVQYENLENSWSIAQCWSNFFSDFDNKMKKYKYESAQFEMSDLEHIVYQITQDHPELVQLYAESIDYWLIDEFQDTSPIQDNILSMFVGSSSQFVVGDPQQSIYLFRGARSEVFYNKQLHFERQNYNVEKLSKNYRSDGELILFINDLFTSIDQQFSKMEPKVNKFDSTKIVSEIASLQPDNENQLKEINELKYICQEIIKLVNSGVKFDEIAVLSRTRSFLSKLSIQLKEHDIPYTLSSASSFSQKRETQDALSLLKFFVNPYDSNNLFELVRSPWFFVSDDHLALVSECEGVNLWSQLLELREQLPIIEKLNQCLNKLNEVGLVQLLKDELVGAGFLDFSYKYDPTGKREANFWKLYLMLRKASRQPKFNALDFINHIQGDVSKDDGSAEGESVASLEPNCVNLMTIHSSKGLEFDYVFIPQCDKKPFKTDKNEKKLVYNNELNCWAPLLIDPDGRLHPTSLHLHEMESYKLKIEQESQRLFYVAVTRAVKKVYFSYIQQKEAKYWASYLPENNDGVYVREGYSIKCSSTIDDSMPSLAQSHLESLELNGPIECISTSVKRASVSKILNGERSKDLNIKKDKTKPTAEELTRSSFGTTLHKYMELLKTNAPEELRHNLYEIQESGYEKIIAAIDYISQCKEPELLTLIQKGHTEWGFQMLENSTIIEGQVDLWAEHNGEIWVVDYKTGNERYSSQAFKQLLYYSKAICAVSNECNQINLVVVYPLAQKTVVKKVKKSDLS